MGVCRALQLTAGALVAGAQIAWVQGQSSCWAVQGASGRMRGDCAAPDSLHNVRCCSEVRLPGYQRLHPDDCAVWSESQFVSIGDGDAGCAPEVTLADAQHICEADHARLCTRAELEADCAQGTGCGLDSDLVWTADPCGDSSDGFDGRACGNFDDRMAALAAECCDEPTEDCSSGIPAICNAGCAELMLPFRDDCLQELTRRSGRKSADDLRTAAGTCSSTPSSSPTTGRQWNILFIGTDQQRTSTLNCYGNSWAHSPNIDRLARDGVRFTEAYTVTPVCSPSRTSVLTGVHVPIHGVYENGIVQYDHRDSLTPYFDVLKEVGFDTALIGKTHFSPTPTTIDHLDAHTGNNDKRSQTTAPEDFLETYLVDETMKWLDARTPGTPWYVYTSMVSPHPPNWVPYGEPWTSAYAGVTLPPINYQGDDIADLPWQTRMLLGMLGKEHNHPPAFPQGHPNMEFIDQPLQQGEGAGNNPGGRYQYYTQAAYVDSQVGRLLDYLDNRRLTDSTLVIFASDHGTELFDHGINNDKHNFLDASLRVPLIMRGAGLPAGETREFATTLDITATILAAAGAAIPNEYQGFDLLGPISQGLPSPRTVGIACEYRAMSVVTPSWKLAYFPEQDEGRLWDRVADPEEQNDLWAATMAENPEVATAKSGLLKALLRWRAQQDAIGFMANNVGGDGPSALHVIEHTTGLRGIDAELRLQEDALAFEHTGNENGKGHRRRLIAKPRALEAMSKQELIEMIKRLG